MTSRYPTATVSLVTKDGDAMAAVGSLAGRIEAWYDHGAKAVGFSGHVHGGAVYV
jgi:hypothetical protein